MSSEQDCVTVPDGGCTMQLRRKEYACYQPVNIAGSPQNRTLREVVQRDICSAGRTIDVEVETRLGSGGR